jgi:MFS family permease
MKPRSASIAIVLAVVYIDMLGIGLAYPILPRLVQQFERGDISRASWIFGLLAAAYALMQFLLAPALGALSDRYGRRPILLLSLFGMGLNYLVLAIPLSRAFCSCSFLRPSPIASRRRPGSCSQHTDSTGAPLPSDFRSRWWA